MEEEKLKNLLRGLPKSPGVYLMKNGKGRIVYVGKAVNLANRVRSYFTAANSDDRFFSRHIHRYVADIEIVITATDKEALLLENSLIKTHTPRFNIKLRDDKDYLSIKLDLAHPWPKFEVIRRPKKDGTLTFGPYHSASAARETLKLIRRHFKIRSCKNREMANRVRPCLQYQIQRCPGPCVLDVNRDDYLQQVDYARLFLLGRREELIKQLIADMHRAADRMKYEKAAVLRDQIKAIEVTLKPQQVVFPGGVDQDIIGFFRQGDQIEIAVLEVRDGRLKGKRAFNFSGVEFPDQEIISSFVVQRYEEPEKIPDEIVVSSPLEDTAGLADLLSDRRQKKTRVIHPKRGKRVAQATMADVNAKQTLLTRLKEKDAVEQQLATLQRKLHLEVLPRRVECVDISHLGGEGTVGAISVLIDGEIAKKHRRTYRIKTPKPGDDYAAMSELLSRRFTRAKNKEDGWQAPDLLVVDGGRGQLAVALAVLTELGLESQPVVALAKERSAGEPGEGDRVFLPGRKNPIPLQARVSALFLLAKARDEAHRLAVSYQRKVRKKKAFGSELDTIPGVGPKIRTTLIKTLGSVKKVKLATIDELCAVPGVGPNLAETIKRALAE